MGHHNRHFAGDALANAGFWSPPTSAANFCEEDYAVTLYIAEFINCLSSLVYVYYALGYSVFPGSRYSFGPRRGRAVPDLLSFALGVVGLGSAAFHGTLRQGAQFSDDLSMLLLGACLVQTIWTHGQRPVTASIITAVVVLGTCAISLIYIRSGDIVIHLIAFSVLIHSVWPRTLYLLHFSAQGRAMDPAERAWLQRRFYTAVPALFLAFLVWNIDLERCLELRHVRNSVGLPWAWALELHGWWHVLTAVGAMEYINLVRVLCRPKQDISAPSAQ